MAQISDKTIAELRVLIRKGDLSPVELMESLLARAEAMEPSLRVWVTLEPERALAAARRSQEQMAGGRELTPLHGIPVGVKDIFYTEGMKTTGCSPIYADFVPDYDATSVALMKRAGAIVMGKTVTTQFASGDPPPTRNPWNAAHSPGGSSTGSAVGVAARQFPGALGSQTAGSVLRPASFNGVVGLKPTFGRISRYGVMPVASSLDTVGTFTRTVEDAALMLNVLAGADPLDPSSSTCRVQDYVAGLDSADAPHVGVVRPFFYDRADAEVRAHTDEVVQRLSDAGARVEEAAVASELEESLLAAHIVLISSEAAAVHQEDITSRPGDYAPIVRGMLESGMARTALDYLNARAFQERFRREMGEVVRRFDVVLSPTTGTPSPPDRSTTGDPSFQTAWTTCGFPSITVPSGLSESGMPLGIQLASSPFREETLLSAARWTEGVLDVTLTPPSAS